MYTKEESKKFFGNLYSKIISDTPEASPARSTTGLVVEAPSMTPSPLGVTPATSDPQLDPWALPELQDKSPKWSDLDTKQRIQRVGICIFKAVSLVILLYIFICSLDFLSSAFRLLGGKAAGRIFQENELLKNPVVGLMIGVLATVLVQSSSTSTSIIVTMVSSEMLTVRDAIPIVMGANIGTSVTNTIVSLAQSTDRNEFRRAFAGATVHDMFNWLSVIVLLPIEAATGYLFHLTSAIVKNMKLQEGSGSNTELLSVITKPFTNLIVQLDKNVIEGIATNNSKYMNMSLLKEYCKTKIISTTAIPLITLADVNSTQAVSQEKCKYLLAGLVGQDTAAGAILLVVSLVLLCGCLVLMVKILHSVLRGRMAVIIKTTLNSDLPGYFAYFTGYLAMLVGCIMTILVQSSSIFTSALTPLVGIGVLSLERVYPLTLGSNIGTTTTGILASLTASSRTLDKSVQIAFCHLFFNLSGILLFYPIPITRIPIRLAKLLGNTTAKYRWFSIFYLIMMFFLLPFCVFLISLGGPIVALCIGVPILVLLFFIIVVNIMQRKCNNYLPSFLRTWDWLPECLHSLDPMDRVVCRLRKLMARCCPCCKCLQEAQPSQNLADLYNTSFTSKTAIYQQSMMTIPSQTDLSSTANGKKSTEKDGQITFCATRV